jgi:hypothetical protein
VDRIQVLNREFVRWRTTLAAENFSIYPGVTVDEFPDDHRLVRAPRNLLSVLRQQGLLLGEPNFEKHDPIAHPVAPARRLMTHQRFAVDRALRRGSLLLGDALGLGKSMTAATIAQAVQETGRPSLVMGPKYLESVWRSELEVLGYTNKDEPLYVCRGADSRAGVPQGVRWVFCHYDILRHWWPTLAFNRWSAVIFDEGHLLKNPKSARGKSTHMVTPGTAVRVVLTGTPVQNQLAEAHNLLTLATGPGTWGHALDFRRRYGGAYQDEYGWRDSAPTNVEELQQRLDDVYLRRDVSVLEDKLPERTRRKITVELKEDVRAKVQDLLAGYTPKQILDALRKSQLSTDVLGWINRLRKATSKAKLSSTIELVGSLEEQGDSVLVFCWQRETVEKIASEFRMANWVHGGMPQEERDRQVASWKADPLPRVLVATYGTLSTGHTLTKANHVVFHDLDMVPATMLQGEGRVYRIGATRPVQSWWMCAEHTLDPFIFSLVNRKAPATAVFGEMGTGDLADFFGDPQFDSEVAEMLEWTLKHGGE